MDEAKTGRAARTDHRLCRAGGNWRDALCNPAATGRLKTANSNQELEIAYICC